MGEEGRGRWNKCFLIEINVIVGEKFSEPYIRPASNMNQKLFFYHVEIYDTPNPSVRMLRFNEAFSLPAILFRVLTLFLGERILKIFLVKIGKLGTLAI